MDVEKDSVLLNSGAFKALLVPNDQYLVLGDNRSNSWYEK